MKNPVIEISCVEVWREISSYIDGDLQPELKARLELHFKRLQRLQSSVAWHKQHRALVDRRRLVSPSRRIR